MALIVLFMVVEIIGGAITGSLALLADAGHMASDAGALALAVAAATLAARAATSERSFGYARAEVLAGLVNGVALVVVALWIVVEALGRLSDPPEVAGAGVLVIGALGLVVNIAAAAVLWRDRRASLNVDAALRHVMADAAGSVGVIAAALVILTTGWTPIDPILSLVIAVAIAVGAWPVIAGAVRILLEAAPVDVDVEAIGREIAAEPGVLEVHDLHVWTIASGFVALSAHVVVGAATDCHTVQRRLAQMLEERFAITHSTLQTAHDHEGFVALDRVGGSGAARPPHRSAEH